jgi:hypothetical protein
LQAGLIKRVVDGASTGIWTDRWIAGHFEGRPITPRDGQSIEQVSDMITAAGTWNESLIRECLFPIDAETILKQLGLGLGTIGNLVSKVSIQTAIQEEDRK